jgi:hypothetical protein
MKLLTVLLLTLCLSALAPHLAVAQDSNSPNQLRKNEGAIPDHYIVVFKQSVPPARVHALATQLAHAHGGTLGFTYQSALRGFSVRMREAQAVALSRNPQVEYVEEDALVEGADVQSNPTWALDRLDQRDLPLNAAYNYATAGAGANAYVIDSGIRMTHQEFGGRALLAYDNVGDGRNGVDCHGHGTHVAGIIGGHTYGVAKGVKLHSVRVLNCSNQAPVANIIAGLDWVAANSVKPAVANLSFITSAANNTIDLAVRNLVASGVTTVVAAGNNNIDAGTRSPARVTEAITVAASDPNDNRASFSNFGSVVDVFAPGVDIISASSVDDASTNIRSGTSSAAPFVVGLAARYLAARPGDQPDAVSQALTNSATPDKVINPGAGSPNLLAYTVSFTVNDNFNDNVRDPSKWLAPTSTDVTVAEQNGRLEITPAANATSYDAYKSAANIDLTDARVSVQASLGQTIYGFGSYLVLYHSSIDYLVIGIGHHDLWVQQVVGGVPSSVSIPYDAVQHAYWRIRHNRADDTINWEASRDGATWAVLRTELRPFPITNLQISLTAGKSDAATPTTTASFDNLLYEATPTPPANAAPQVNAGLDATVNEGSTFSGTASFTDIDNTDTWRVTVDYGDGTGAKPVIPTQSKTIPLSHVYKDNAANPYTVTVTVTDAAGASSSDTALVTSVNVSPTARLEDTPSTCPAGYRIKFYSFVDDPSQADREARFMYLWTVTKNGGAYVEPGADQQNDNDYDITPEEDGTYVVTLRATDKDGGAVNISRTIIVTKAEPSDDFNDNWTNVARWYQNGNTDIRVSERDGQLQVSPFIAAAYDGYYARTGINMTNQGAMVEAVRPTFGDGLDTYFILEDKSNGAQNRLLFNVGGASGYLRMEERYFNGTYTSISTRIPYDAAQHRFWRFRHDAAADTIKWETSPDGLTWTVRHSAARAFSLTNMQAQLYAGRSTTATTPTPMEAIFDNYRVGKVTKPSSLLSDNFDDNLLDPALWSVLNPMWSVAVREQNQRLEIVHPRRTSSYYDNGVESAWSYNFWNKTLQVEIPQVGEAESSFTLKLDQSNYYSMEIGSGWLKFTDRVDGFPNWYHVTYSPSAHRFQRFRHNAAANTMSFEVSPDSRTWTTIRSVPVGFSLNSLKVVLKGKESGSDAPGTTVFDNLRMEANQ